MSHEHLTNNEIAQKILSIDDAWVFKNQHMLVREFSGLNIALITFAIKEIHKRAEKLGQHVEFHVKGNDLWVTLMSHDEMLLEADTFELARFTSDTVLKNN